MPSLLKCIQESRISIPIISPDYVSSRSCLEELAKIMECKRTIGQIVMPIFFHVDVGDVKNQTGSFAQAFSSHEERFQKNKVMEWRNALREVGKLKGYDSKNVENGHEAGLVQQVLRQVLNELNTRIMDVVDCYKLTSLVSLDLVDCYKPNKLPSRLGAMESLTQLLLHESSIEQLPDSIGHLKSLQTLGLDKCRSLTRLPNSLGNLESLRELSLRSTSIREIPDSIGSLKKLKALRASGCRSLTMLPNSICGLESLITLELDGTHILELPESIGALLKLENLGLEQCTSLGKLPDSLGRMESLTRLILSGSPIKEFPGFHEPQYNVRMLDITLILNSLQRCL